MDIEDNEKGAQVKTGDKFGIAGYWVNKNLDDSLKLIEVGDPDDEVPPDGDKRLTFFYYGKNKPSPEQMKEFIKKQVRDF